MPNFLMKRFHGIRCILTLALLLLVLASCNMPGAMIGGEDPTANGTDSVEAELGQQEQALRKGQCPSQVIYDLVYDHEMVVNETGEQRVHLEWHEEEGSAFPLWFERSGKVNNEDMENQVYINVSGWVKVGTDECPVNYLQGSWPLTAEIKGRCKKGIVKLEVVEEFQDNTLTGTCEDIPFTGPGTYSAPELELSFDLSDPRTNDGITAGSKEGSLFILYWYELRPSETFLEPVPLDS